MGVMTTLDQHLKQDNLVDVRDTLLESIKQAAQTRSAPDLLRLAEAWAWLVEPHQPHGGGGEAKSR
jgi:hypothetical protein